MSFDRSDRTFLRNLVAGAVDEIVAEVAAAIDEIVADDADDQDPDDDSDPDADVDDAAAVPKDDGHVAVPTHTVVAARRLTGERCVVVGVVGASRADEGGNVTDFEVFDPNSDGACVRIRIFRDPVIPQPQLRSGAIVAVDGIAQRGEIVPQIIRVLAAPAPGYVLRSSAIPSGVIPPPPKHDLPKKANLVECRQACIQDNVTGDPPVYTAFLTADCRKLYMQCQRHGNWVRYDPESATDAPGYVWGAHTDYTIGATCPDSGATALVCHNCGSRIWTVAWVLTEHSSGLRLICATWLHARDVKVADGNTTVTVSECYVLR